MRNIIIGLSLIFFLLTGLIFIKISSNPEESSPSGSPRINSESLPQNLEIPDQSPGQGQPSPQPSKPLPEQLQQRQSEAGESRAERTEQDREIPKDANKELIEKLQKTISDLETKLSDKKEPGGTALPREPAMSSPGPAELSESAGQTGQTEETETPEPEKAAETMAAEPSPAPADKEQPSKALILAVLGDGAFQSGKIEVTPDFTATVKALVPAINGFTGYSLIIEGHTDNQPIKTSANTGYNNNMELSYLRAKAVADILIQSGIPSSRISVIGYGDTKPLESNDTEEGRLKNRRVVIKIVP